MSNKREVGEGPHNEVIEQGIIIKRLDGSIIAIEDLKREQDQNRQSVMSKSDGQQVKPTT